MFKDTTYLELEPYAEDDRLIAIVQCDALSIRSPGSRSERQEIRATVRTAAVLPDGAELQLAAYAQGAPLMTVGHSYLIAAYRESTGGPWALVEARPSSGTNASREWEAAQAELAPSATRGGAGPGASDVTKQMDVAEQLVLDDRAARTSSHGLTLQVLGAEIASEPPPQPGVSRPSTTRTVIRVRVAFGTKTEELTFTPESPGVASVTDHEWEGYRIELVDRTLTRGTRDQWTTTFTVTSTNAPSAGKPGAAPTASATAPMEWSITYDDLSAFHLDGVFLRYRNDGEYVAQILVRGARGVDELIFEGHAGVAAGALPATYQEALDVELVALPFAQLTSPPPRTLVPDTVVTSLTFVRTEGKATQSTELRYVKGSGKDPLTPAATTLVIAVQKLIAEIQATTPKTVKRNIQTPTKLPR